MASGTTRSARRSPPCSSSGSTPHSSGQRRAHPRRRPEKVEQALGTRVLVLDLEATNQMDTTSADTLESLITQLRARGIDVYLVRVMRAVRKTLRRPARWPGLGGPPVAQHLAGRAGGASDARSEAPGCAGGTVEPRGGRARGGRGAVPAHERSRHAAPISRVLTDAPRRTSRTGPDTKRPATTRDRLRSFRMTAPRLVMPCRAKCCGGHRSNRGLWGGTGRTEG